MRREFRTFTPRVVAAYEAVALVEELALVPLRDGEDDVEVAVLGGGVVDLHGVVDGLLAEVAARVGRVDRLRRVAAAGVAGVVVPAVGERRQGENGGVFGFTF